MRRAVFPLYISLGDKVLYSGSLLTYIHEKADDSDIQYIRAMGIMTAWIMAYRDTVSMQIKMGIDTIIDEQLQFNECDFLKLWSYVYTETQQRVTEYLSYTPINAVFKGNEVTI